VADARGRPPPRPRVVVGAADGCVTGVVAPAPETEPPPGVGAVAFVTGLDGRTVVRVETEAVVGGTGGGAGLQTVLATGATRGGGSTGEAAPSGSQRQPSTTAGSTRVLAGPIDAYVHAPFPPCQYDQ